jgi:hypothetical protein
MNSDGRRRRCAVMRPLAFATLYCCVLYRLSADPPLHPSIHPSMNLSPYPFFLSFHPFILAFFPLTSFLSLFLSSHLLLSFLTPAYRSYLLPPLFHQSNLTMPCLVPSVCETSHSYFLNSFHHSVFFSFLIFSFLFSHLPRRHALTFHLIFSYSYSTSSLSLLIPEIKLNKRNSYFLTVTATCE